MWTTTKFSNIVYGISQILLYEKHSTIGTSDLINPDQAFINKDIRPQLFLHEFASSKFCAAANIITWEGKSIGAMHEYQYMPCSQRLRSTCEANTARQKWGARCPLQSEERHRPLL